MTESEHTIESECTGVRTPARLLSPELILRRKTAEVVMNLIMAVLVEERDECALSWLIADKK